MGGRIWVTSEPGRGSEFHFCAPFGVVPEPAHGRAQLRWNSWESARLLVEDNESSRSILSRRLTGWGMDTVAAVSAAEALALAGAARDEGRPFALLLADSTLPDMDGLRLIEEIRHANRCPQAVILLTSAGGDAPESARMRKARLTARLSKPVWFDDLYAVIVRGLAGGSSAPAPPPTPASAASLKSSSPLRILLAEDNPVNQVLAVRILSRRGHSIAVCGNGREALARLDQEKFDVLLTDMQMPEMDGFETAEAIRRREQETGDRLPIVAMTALALKGDRERCLAVGMDAYVTKPVRQSELIETVERFCPQTESIT